MFFFRLFILRATPVSCVWEQSNSGTPIDAEYVHQKLKHINVHLAFLKLLSKFNRERLPCETLQAKIKIDARYARHIQPFIVYRPSAFAFADEHSSDAKKIDRLPVVYLDSLMSLFFYLQESLIIFMFNAKSIPGLLFWPRGQFPRSSDMGTMYTEGKSDNYVKIVKSWNK